MVTVPQNQFTVTSQIETPHTRLVTSSSFQTMRISNNEVKRKVGSGLAKIQGGSPSSFQLATLFQREQI